MFESFQENEQPQHEQEQVKTAVFSIVLGNVDNLSSVYMWALCFKQTANTNKYQWQRNSSGAWEYPDFLQGHDGSQYKQNNKYIVSMVHKSKRTHKKKNQALYSRPLGKTYIATSPQTSAFLIQKNWLLLWECLSNKRDRKAHKWNSCPQETSRNDTDNI